MRIFEMNPVIEKSLLDSIPAHYRSRITISPISFPNRRARGISE